MVLDDMNSWRSIIKVNAALHWRIFSFLAPKTKKKIRAVVSAFPSRRRRFFLAQRSSTGTVENTSANRFSQWSSSWLSFLYRNVDAIVVKEIVAPSFPANVLRWGTFHLALLGIQGLVTALVLFCPAISVASQLSIVLLIVLNEWAQGCSVLWEMNLDEVVLHAWTTIHKIQRPLRVIITMGIEWANIVKNFSTTLQNLHPTQYVVARLSWWLERVPDF